MYAPTTGASAALTVAVEKRSTSRKAGTRPAEVVTTRPLFSSALATRASISGVAHECNRHTATLVAPEAWTRRARSARAFSVGRSTSTTWPVFGSGHERWSSSKRSRRGTTGSGFSGCRA